jgi:hypothetical protein
MVEIQITDLPNGNTRWSANGVTAGSLCALARLLAPTTADAPWKAKRRDAVALLGGSLHKLATLDASEGKGRPRFHRHTPNPWAAKA